MPDVTGEPAPVHRGRSRDFLVMLVIVAGVVGAVLWSELADALAPRPTSAQCEQLLRQWLQQSRRARSASDQRTATAGRLDAMLPAASRQRSVARCERQLTASAVACALGAPNVDELERCLQ